MKSKHDQAEHQINIYAEDMHAQKLLIDDQHRTIQLLESRLEESERKRNNQESTWVRSVEIEREKQRVRTSELLSEIE